MIVNQNYSRVSRVMSKNKKLLRRAILTNEGMKGSIKIIGNKTIMKDVGV